jgi:predicted aspartyl protease
MQENDIKHSIVAVIMNQFAVYVIAALFTAGLHAETSCPANIKPVPFQNSQQHQMIVQVSINNAGPFDFLLDTGAQMTVIDHALAVELGLATTGMAKVAGMSIRGQTTFARIRALQLGTHVSRHQRVLVYDMNKVQRAGFTIRGLLGEDVLSRFDVFINNAHRYLCIDEAGAMEVSVKSGLRVEGK